MSQVPLSGTRTLIWSRFRYPPGKNSRLSIESRSMQLTDLPLCWYKCWLLCDSAGTMPARISDEQKRKSYLSGNEVYYTNSSILLVDNMLRSKLHHQKVLIWFPVHIRLANVSNADSEIRCCGTRFSRWRLEYWNSSGRVLIINTWAQWQSPHAWIIWIVVKQHLVQIGRTDEPDLPSVDLEYSPQLNPKSGAMAPGSGGGVRW